MYAIRRDLKGGKTHGFWQISKCRIRSKLGKAIEYIDGKKYTLILKGCYLHNSVAAAKKIFEGADRERCAWIVCDSFEIVPIKDIDGIEISYNPKKSPHYLCDDENVDKTEHDCITTKNYQMYVCD